MKNWLKLLCLLSVVLIFPVQVFAAQTWINETVTVSNLSYRAWSASFHAGDRLTGSIYSSNDINFYILSSNNFVAFSQGQSFYASYSRSRVSSLPSFDFTVPSDGTWYVVLDNQYSLFTSKSVAVTIYLEPYSQSGGYAPDSYGALLMAVVIIIAILTIVAIVLAYLAHSASIKKKSAETALKAPS